MIRHYLTFQRQGELLDQRLSGWIFCSCWLQEKERLYLEFTDGKEQRFAEISLNLRFGYGLPVNEVHRARKNTIDLFPALAGLRLLQVEVDDQERLLHFRFEREEELLVFFYGKGSGNILRRREGEIVESVMQYQEEYDAVLRGEEEEPVGRHELREGIVRSEGSIRQALTGSIRRLGRPLAAEALWRTGISEEKKASDSTLPELDSLLNQVDALYAEASGSELFRLYETSDDVIFSLIELHHLEEGGEVRKVEEFDDLSQAIRIIRSAWFRKKEFNHLYGLLKGGLERETKRTLRSLEHAEQSVAHIGRGEEWERMANLLLAHLHQLKRGESQVVLADWEGEEREIKLDPKLTPAENAERYYRKARGARKEAEHSRERAVSLRERSDLLDKGLDRLATASTMEELQEIRREYGELIGMREKPKEEQREERYRRFVVDGGFEVFAGKNAANNDELTLRFARPNDIWLHARGSSGSHVVLRWNEGEGRPPKRTLEEAAMIAAYYSGAKHSKLVPVAWTRKKYVRKPKGAAPGAVVVGREEVVMVEPRLPQGAGSSEE